MRRVGCVVVGAVALALAPASSGLAHVGVTPAPGGTAAARGEIVISVPNESQSADTTSVAVQLPVNVLQVEILTVAGWRSRGTTEPLASPVQIGDEVVETRTSTVIWSGGRIRPGRRAAFRLRLLVRSGTRRQGLPFPAVQRYSDGTVVRWIGGPGSQKPAGVLPSALPVVRVTTPVPQTPTVPGAATVPPPLRPAATTTTAPTPTTAPAEPVSDADGGSTGLIVGLILAAAGLLGAGAVAIARRRKKR